MSRRREIPTEQWKLDREVPATSAIEALMFHDETFDPRTEGLLDLFDEILTEEEKWVVEAIVFDRRPYREVAVQMNRSPGYVHKVNHRALGKLRERIENANTEDHS
jgi:DNA-directed RNA polymerase specialized sigma24 family protein